MIPLGWGRWSGEMGERGQIETIREKGRANKPPPGAYFQLILVWRRRCC